MQSEKILITAINFIQMQIYNKNLEFLRRLWDQQYRTVVNILLVYPHVHATQSFFY